MAANSSSPTGMSDVEQHSSPPNAGKHFFAGNTAHATDDEDNDDDRGRHGHAHAHPHAFAHSRAHQDDDTSRLTQFKSAGGRGRTGRESTGGGGKPERADREDSSSGGGGGAGANGSRDVSSIGKIRHLKKEDGEPLWRVDIQYDFLRAVFDDERKVFTNSYEPDGIGKQCFADLYIDTMARSSKTSKILHDKLMYDREAAKGMAMVCLLVNIGRMNTTLNFFPEMRAQLRTYHAIPSLQASQEGQDYKQLQDAPRLKSILKGGTDDRPEPRSLDRLQDMDVPRTNPVNLIFLICQSAAKVAMLHFRRGEEFHDLIMRTNYSSKSRATAFLWLMWFYLESDFTEEGCEENPFGPGVDYGVNLANQGVPLLQPLTPEEQELENIDTPVEREFGLSKKLHRHKILLNEQFVEAPAQKRSSRSHPRSSVAKDEIKEPEEFKEATGAGTDSERSGQPAILPRIRPPKHDSDVDSSRSTPPPRVPMRISAGGMYMNTAPRRAGPLKYQIVDGSSPARQPPLLQQLQQQQQQQLQQARRRRKQKGDRARDVDDDDADGGTHTPVPPSRKPRPPTAHQIAVENNRKQRIEYLLSRGVERKHHRARKARRTEGAILRALRRLDEVADPFEDSEDEDSLYFNRGLFSSQPGAPQNMPTGNAFRERGFYGLVQLSEELDDFGEEVAAYSAAIRRSCRRINRWETSDSNAVVAPVKRPRVHTSKDDEGGDFKDPNETEEELEMPMDVETPPPAKKRRATGGARAGTGDGARAVKTAASRTAQGSARGPSKTASRRGRGPSLGAKGPRFSLDAASESGDHSDSVDENEELTEEQIEALLDEYTAGKNTKDAAYERKMARMELRQRSQRAAEKRKAREMEERKVAKTSTEQGQYHDDGEDEGDEDEADEGGAAGGGDELNDMEKTLLGMGGGDSESD